MVGPSGFEPETFCTPSKRATRLRYGPPTSDLRALSDLPTLGMQTNNAFPSQEAKLYHIIICRVNRTFPKTTTNCTKPPPPT